MESLFYHFAFVILVTISNARILSLSSTFCFLFSSFRFSAVLTTTFSLNSFLPRRQNFVLVPVLVDENNFSRTRLLPDVVCHNSKTCLVVRLFSVSHMA